MRRGGLIVGVTVAVVVSGGVPHAAVAASQRPALVQRVAAFGAAVVVPRSWPVIDFRHRAAGCIRLDRHAVYVGQPARSTCPAHRVGSVAAVQIRAATSLDRASRNAAIRVNRLGAVYRDGGAVDPAAVFLLGRGRTAVVVTRSDTPAGRAVVASVRPAAGAPVTSSAAGTAPPSAMKAPPRAGSFTGEGFDTCSAPSAGAMQAWLASRYRAVNIYMGGSDRGCAQPNLTAAWVSTVVAQGWTLIPTYVGLQAPCWGGSGSKIDPNNAAAEGVSSADDAANGMAALGLGQGNPVYFDMEAYDTGNGGCVSAVETFLDSWTAELHNRGYVSGVYSSAASGITNLVQERSSPSYHLPDDIWFADWDNSDTVYGDPYVPDGDWNNHHRIHQYAGGHNETYGGVTIDIDNDAVDGATAPGGTPPGLATPNLLSNASFELGGGSGWKACNDAGSVNYTSYTNPGYAKEGAAYEEMNTSVSGGSVCQDVTAAPQPGQSYVFSVWLRTPPGGAASFSGTLALWARGGTQESGSTSFTVGKAWSLVSVPVDIANSGHTSLRAEIYMGTTGTNLDADGASLAAGNAQTPPADPWPPQASLHALPATTLRPTAVLSWSGSDTGSGVASFDLRWRRAKFSTGFGSWQYPSTWQQTTATTGALKLSPGYSYCVQVRARDYAGNISPWTPQRCVTRALDDRALHAGPGWSRSTGSGYYLGTFTVTSRYHRVLSLTGVKLDQVGLVATRCHGCGTVAIYAGTKQIGKISLSASSTLRKQVIMLPKFAYRTATVTIKTVSTGETVQIDGLITSKP